MLLAARLRCAPSGAQLGALNSSAITIAVSLLAQRDRDPGACARDVSIWRARVGLVALEVPVCRRNIRVRGVGVTYAGLPEPRT